MTAIKSDIGKLVDDSWTNKLQLLCRNLKNLRIQILKFDSIECGYLKNLIVNNLGNRITELQKDRTDNKIPKLKDGKDVEFHLNEMTCH